MTISPIDSAYLYAATVVSFVNDSSINAAHNTDRHVSSKGGNYDNVTVVLGDTINDRSAKHL